MEAVQNLLFGFSIALQPVNLFWCFAGVFLGTMVGVLPGIGPAGTVAILLPLTLNMRPTTALIMLLGIYYGAKYGGSTTSILLNIPGESSSVATCLDGYQMARKGRAGPALGISAIASFIAGTFGVAALMLAAPPLAQFALRFAPPEYFALMFLGMSMVAYLTGDSLLKGLLSAAVGVWLGIIGTDLFSAQSRYTFGRPELLDGLDFIVVSIGLFSIAEIMLNLESSKRPELFPVPKGLKNLLPNRQDLKDCRFAFVNGSLVGFFIGMLPGAGATIASFISYGIEKAFSRHPEKFGTGVIEGVAAPEGANNSDAGGALVPLLTLGIPGSNVGAILLAALFQWGLRPGPLLIQEHPELFWGVVASMYVGNLMLLVLNLPLVPLFAQLLRVPYYMLYPVIVGISIVGVYSVNQSMFDVWVMGIFGLIGYFMRKFDFPVAPLALGMVLGTPLERALRQSLIMSQGSPTIFFNRSISLALLLLSMLVIAMPIVQARRRAPSGVTVPPRSDLS
ncbi:MAG TPA: tripartite tricarboxylate transporter permease [Candidatus Acidoferrales bacterium]|nr:tripartite tricarboxylate transporter permease [Candidatus Acidoferrales bacterium]